MLDRTAEGLLGAASRLLSRDRVFDAVQRGLSASLTARKAFERNVVRVLSGVNVPTRQDLDRLHERVQTIDEALDDALRRVDRLTAQAARRGALPPRR